MIKMLFGDERSFAVECEILGRADKFVYCAFRLWAGGVPLGDWEEHSVLGAVIFATTVFQNARAARYLPQADKLETASLWEFITRYTEANNMDDLQVAVKERYRVRFLLHEIAIDSLFRMGYILVVSRKDGVQRLLWKARDASEITEVVLAEQTVERVLDEFLGWATAQ